MGNFEDFDLDLRNVASNGEAEPNGSVIKTAIKTAITVSKMSLKNKCKSVDTPTTGRSAICCKRKNVAADPQCI